MTFTTLTFIIFLSVVFPLYWGLKHRKHQNVLLLIVSYIFYGWWDIRFCFLMLATSLVDYLAGLLIFRSHNPRWRKLILICSIVSNLGVLGLFKYFNFFAESFSVFLSSFGWHVNPIVIEVILPAGISFYTFQALSYTIDIYHKKLEPTSHLIEYLAFISFFPHLVAGPIMRAAHLLPQFIRDRRFDYDAAVDGCRQMLWGFFKKLVLADNLSPVVDAVYSNAASFNGPQLAVATFCFAFQIYWDFSAYSDIAIGTAKLFGFKLMRNFAYPYFSQSMGEFWRRWHISLSTWFRDYLYIPMGGGQTSQLKKIRNVVSTFLLSGFWHGASWNFLIWGGVNGLTVLPETLRADRKTAKAADIPGGPGMLPPFSVAIRIVFTFLVVCAAWIFFRAPSLPAAWTIVRRIISDFPHIDAWKTALVPVVANSPLGRKVLLLTATFVGIEWASRDQDHPLNLSWWPVPVRWLAYTVLLWGTLGLGVRHAGRFIYFQF